MHAIQLYATHSPRYAQKKNFFLNDTNSHFNFFFKKYNWKLSYVNRFWSSPQNQYQRHSISTTKLAISISQPKKKKKKKKAIKGC